MSADKGGNEKYLEESLSQFRQKQNRAVGLSGSNIGVEHTGRQNRALAVFAKLVAHTLTLESCVSNYTEKGVILDHFSIATLGRAVIDASIMSMYITEPSLTLLSWNLRRHVLFLHDLVNRKRLLEAMGGKARTTRDLGFFQNYEEIKEELRRKIGGYAEQSGLPEEKVRELQSGQLVFVDGVRSAVREAGWNVDQYEFIQSYWSAYVHSYPVSFYRMSDHKVSFDGKPSQFQIGFSATVLEVCAGTLADVSTRIDTFCKRIDNDPLGHVE